MANLLKKNGLKSQFHSSKTCPILLSYISSLMSANENVGLQMYTSYAQHTGSILHTTFPSH